MESESKGRSEWVHSLRERKGVSKDTLGVAEHPVVSF